MNRKEAYAKFSTQRTHARYRGIEWKLTFEEWLAWWGDDLARRGVGHDELQMQRFHDSGPYAIGNIKKGFPMDNRSTAGNVLRGKNAERARVAHQHRLDEAPAVSCEDREHETEDEYELRRMFNPRWHHWSKFIGPEVRR